MVQGFARDAVAGSTLSLRADVVHAREVDRRVDTMA
jgi:hypothetical protein